MRHLPRGYANQFVGQETHISSSVSAFQLDEKPASRQEGVNLLSTLILNGEEMYLRRYISEQLKSKDCDLAFRLSEKPDSPPLSSQLPFKSPFSCEKFFKEHAVAYITLSNMVRVISEKDYFSCCGVDDALVKCPFTRTHIKKAMPLNDFLRVAEGLLKAEWESIQSELAREDFEFLTLEGGFNAEVWRDTLNPQKKTNPILHSALFQLSLPKSQPLFLSVLDSLAPFITVEMLIEPVTEACLEHACETPLFWLCRTPNGRQILSELLNRPNSGLSKNFTVEMLSTPLPESHPVYPGETPLFWLAQSLRAVDSLKKMLSEEASSSLSAEFLLRELPTTHEDLAGKSLFKQLSEGLYLGRGHTVLCSFLNTFASIAEGITPDVLLTTQGDSPFYSFCLDEAGQEILNILLKQHPDLARSITPDVLSRISQHLRLCKSYLWHLSSGLAGREFLWNVFSSDAELTGQVSVDLLLGLSSNGRVFDSPFFRLCSDESGVKTLALLLDQNDTLAEAITLEILTEPFPNNYGGQRAYHPHAFAGQSPFRCLYHAKHGQAFLLALMEKKNCNTFTEGLKSELQAMGKRYFRSFLSEIDAKRYPLLYLQLGGRSAPPRGVVRRPSSASPDSSGLFRSPDKRRRCDPSTDSKDEKPGPSNA